MLVVGIDEVGRGCIAGPLVVGAVVLNYPIEGLRDSKVLTRKRRETLAKEITKQAAYSSLGWVSASELDQIGLSRALTLAADRALSKLKLGEARFILDGNFNYLPKRYQPVDLVVHGDATVPSISAASIIAKVARDNYMIELASKYPGYGFEKHVGYATKMHLNALAELGVKSCHRQTFEPVKTISKAP